MIGSCVALTMTGCSFQGINSLPLPGAVGRGSDAVTYHVEIANVATLESNSPVLIDDVVVGSVGKMTVEDWHANVEISVKPDVVVPANAVATVGQTSLLGSMHLALNPPLGEKPSGRLPPGCHDPAERVVDLPDHGADAVVAVDRRQRRRARADRRHRPQLQRRGQWARTRDPRTADPTRQLRRRPRCAARQHRRVHPAAEPGRGNVRRAARRHRPRAQGDSARARRADQGAADADHRAHQARTVQRHGHRAGQRRRRRPGHGPEEPRADAQGARRRRARPELGADLGDGVPVRPGFADTITRGDYINLFAAFDLTYPRLKKTLLLGTRWGDENAKLIPAPGDPYYLNYSYDPMTVGDRTAAGRGAARAATVSRRCATADHRAGAAGGAAAARHRRCCQTQAGARLARSSRDRSVPTRRHRPRSRCLRLPTYLRHREVVADADTLRPKSADHLHHRVDRRCGVMLFTYMQVPTLLGVGRITVKLELPAAGGLYRFSNVTYRGVEVGKVTDVKLTRDRCGSDAVARHVAEDSRRPAGRGPKRLRGRRAVRRSAAAHRLGSVPGGRLGDRGGRTPRSRRKSARCSTR